MSTDQVGESDWTFTRLPNGRYRGQETRLGGATGEAAFDGRRFDMSWATGGFSGDLAVALEPDCSGGLRSHMVACVAAGSMLPPSTATGRERLPRAAIVPPTLRRWMMPCT